MATLGEPRYFVAVFGDPGNPPDKDLVESGRYTPDPKYAPFEPKSGDLMLLYCTEQYPGFSKQAPGAGEITRVDNEAIEYRWIPFFTPLSKRALDNTFESDDLKKLRNIWMSSHWLFEISKLSFSKAVGGRLNSVRQP